MRAVPVGSELNEGLGRREGFECIDNGFSIFRVFFCKRELSVWIINVEVEFAILTFVLSVDKHFDFDLLCFRLFGICH